jgi:hypothetical protein
MRTATTCLFLVLATGCSDSSDETQSVPGCDGVIPESQYCPTPCNNWIAAIKYACDPASTWYPSPPTVGECPSYYSETILGADAHNIFFYDKKTLAFSGAVLRGNDGRRICVGTIPGVEACGENTLPCSVDGGADSALE